MEKFLQNIIEGCKQNVAFSQQQLYKYCFDDMIKVCLRYHYNKEDAAASYNTAMYNIFVKINQFKNDGEFLGWVRRIMVNTCLNAIKKQAKFETSVISDKDYESFYINPNVYSNLQAKEILQLVQSLPQSTALVFNLYIMDGYTHNEIASQLKISIGTSKWHLNNARIILKEKIINMSLNENRKNA